LRWSVDQDAIVVIAVLMASSIMRMAAVLTEPPVHELQLDVHFDAAERDLSSESRVLRRLEHDDNASG